MALLRELKSVAATAGRIRDSRSWDEEYRKAVKAQESRQTETVDIGFCDGTSKIGSMFEVEPAPELAS